MNKSYFAAALLAFSPVSIATDPNEAYLDTSSAIVAIPNTHREAEAWAVCSAAYDLMAAFIEGSKPATAKRMSEMSNGAEVAITMTLVLSKLTEYDLENPSSVANEFNATWKYAKFAGAEFPKSQMTMIESDAEILRSMNGDDWMKPFMNKLTNTVVYCLKNAESQQYYIDTFRELVATGLLAEPE